MDILTLAMAKPKVINLDEYGIGERILNIITAGTAAGTDETEAIPGFWEAVSADRELRIKMSMGNYTIFIDGVNRLFLDYGNYGCGIVNFSFMLPDGNGEVIPVSVSINDIDGSAFISVRVG